MKVDPLADYPGPYCLRCRHFGMDEHPRHIRTRSGRYVEGWVLRCDHDPARKDPAGTCERFEDAEAHDAAQARARGGYDKPVARTDTAQPVELFGAHGVMTEWRNGVVD